MKRIATILLLVLYTNVAFCVAVDYHYCNNHLTNITVLNFGGDGGCGTKGICADCCKHKTHCVQADNHQAVQPFVIVNWSSFYIGHAIEKSQNITLIWNDKTDLFICTPKRSYTQPIFLLNRVFRI